MKAGRNIKPCMYMLDDTFPHNYHHSTRAVDVDVITQLPDGHTRHITESIPQRCHSRGT